MSDHISNRGCEWRDFADKVFQHIEDYTVPQYGDLPHDQASEFTSRDISMNMHRYLNRVGSNARGLNESLRDCLKLAHYACMLKAALEKEAPHVGI